MESLLRLATRVLTDPAGLWRQAHGEARIALQQSLFSEGVPFDGGGSSALWVAGSLVNEPSDRGGERAVGSILALVPERNGDDEE